MSHWILDNIDERRTAVLNKNVFQTVLQDLPKMVLIFYDSDFYYPAEDVWVSRARVTLHCGIPGHNDHTVWLTEDEFKNLPEVDYEDEDYISFT